MTNAWTRSDDVVWEELDGEVLLVSPRSGGSWLLNAAASAVWKLCDGRKAIGSARAFCESLERLGLLKASGEAQLAGTTMHFDVAPMFTQLNAGGGGRRRPRPSGVSGPV